MLHLLYRSLTYRSFPRSWKIGRFTALHEQGDRTNVNIYRPITIFPIITKLLVLAVHDHCIYFIAKQILAKGQFGFQVRKSTSAALIHFTDEILRCIVQAKSLGQLVSIQAKPLIRSYLTNRSVFTLFDKA